MIILVTATQPISQLRSRRHKKDLRKEAFIVRTLFKLIEMIYASLDGKVVEKDLLRPHAYYRTIDIEKAMNSLALLETKDVHR
jgi:hypothetical protein